jgi:hypothetical protein
MVRASTTDGPSRADYPATPGRWSGQLLPNENHRLDGSKRSKTRTCEEHEEHPDELRLADSPPATRGRSARHRNSSPSLKLQEPNHLSVHGSPKRIELLRKDLAEMKTVPRGCYAPKLEPLNELNHRESNHNRAQPKT